MRRLSLDTRPDWQGIARKEGFVFHLTDGSPYWDESACMAMTLRQVEDGIEAPTDELHAMCLDVADRASVSEDLMSRLGVPDAFRDVVAESWRRRDPSVLGRMDLAYDGRGPAKLLEYNADTPTSLYEAAVFQWQWLRDGIESGYLPADADQFNSIHERLVAAYGKIPNESMLHFASVADEPEDFGTVHYMMDCALQGGQRPKFLDLSQIGVDAQGRFTDQDDMVIDRLSKLYPWEFMFMDEYGKHVARSGTSFLEPAWKAMLSTKAILPVLWELHGGHPNLLPAFFEGDPRADALTSYVRKPIFSREGANTTLVRDGETVAETEGLYGAQGFVRQAATDLFSGPGGYAVIGSWVVDGEAAGMGVREDSGPITRNVSRFLPHVIVDDAWSPPASRKAVGEPRPAPVAKG